MSGDGDFLLFEAFSQTVGVQVRLESNIPASSLYNRMRQKLEE